MDVLPLEIIEIILNNIDDTNTYKNARRCCKLWYNILKVLKYFRNGEVTEYAHFYKRMMLSYYPNGNIYREYIINNLNFIYNIYNERGIIVKTVKNKSANIIETKIVRGNTIITKEYDMLTGNINKSENLLLVPYNCLIQ